MTPPDNNLEQTPESLAYSSSLETQPAAQAPSAAPVSSSSPAPLPPRRKPVSLFKYNKTAFVITLLALAVIALIGGGGLLLSGKHGAKQPGQTAGPKADDYAISSLPLQGLQPNQQLQVGGTDHLVVNGQLQVSNGLVIAPTAAPTAPTAGQIYYNKVTNAPYYYNGTQFISLAPTALPQYVSSIGGTAGAISVGSGLQVTSGQLSLTGTAQSLTGGKGIAVNGTTIDNQGVISLAAGTANVVISQDGNGNYTLSDNSIVGSGSDGEIALFTGGKTLGGSILNQSGSSLTVAGSLTVTGAISSNTLQQTAAGNNVNISAGNDSLIFTAGSRTFEFPTSGPGSQVICTTGISCASGGGQAVLLQPGSSQLDTGSSSSIFINNTGGGNLLQLQGAGSDRFVVTNAGNTTIAGSLAVQGASTTIGTASQQGSLILDDGNGGSNKTATLQGVTTLGQNTTYTLPDPGQSTATICLSTNNCTAVGTAGGDLAGSYPSPTIAKLQGSTLTISSPSSGQILQYNGSAFVNQALSGDITINGSGVTAIGAGKVTNADLVNNSLTVTAGTGLSGGGSVGLGGASTGLSVNYGSTTNTAVQGSTSLVCASGSGNLTGGGNTITLGTGGTCNSLTITNSPTFSGTLAAQGAGGITVGIAGSTIGSLNLANATTTNEVILQGLNPSGSGNATIRIPTIAGGATDTVCLLSLGNCVGTGGGIVGSGTIGNIAKFNASGSITNSTLSESGSTLTASGNMVIQGANSLSLGTSSSTNGSVSFADSLGVHTVTLQAPSSDPTSNLVFKLPSSYGSNGNCLQSDGIGGLTFASCTGGAGGGVTSLDAQTGILTLNNSTGSSGAITINNAKADGSTEGIATFNASNFTDNGSGVINTVQNIATSSTPTFSALALQGSTTGLAVTGAPTNSATSSLIQVGAAIVGGNTTANGGTYLGLNEPASGAGSAADFLNFQVNGTPKLQVTNTGNITGGTFNTATISGGSLTASNVNGLNVSSGTISSPTISGTVNGSGSPTIIGFGTINSQTISSSANFTGTLAVQGASSLTLGTASTNTGAIILNNSTNAHTLTLQSGATASNLTFTLPTADGGNGNCLQTNGSGMLSFQSCTGGAGGGVTSLDAQTGILTLNNSTGSSGAITINNAKADGSTEGIATFNASNFTDNGSGVINTVQNIATSSTPTFSALALQGASALTLGTASTNTGAIVFHGSGGAATLTLQGPTAPTTGNFTLSIPAITANANICTDNSICTGYAPSTGGNYIAKNTNDTSNASFVGNLIGLTNTNTGAAGVLSLANSGTNSTLNVTSSANPTTGQAIIFASDTNASLSGNLIDLQSGVSLTSKFSVDTSGDVTAAGTYNTNTFTSSALTFGTAGTATIQSAASQALNITGNAASTISTSAGTLTLQGGSGTVSLGTSTALSNTSGALTITGTTNLILKSTAGNSITLDSGTVGPVNIGTGTSGKTIQIGNTANAVTDTIDIGNNATASSVNNVNIGSTLGASLVKIQGGTGGIVLKSGATSTTALQIQNSSATVLFDTDTTNSRIGIDNAAPAYALDVTGDINASSTLKVGGVTVCTSAGCTGATTSGSFINNATTTQAADFNIQGTAIGQVVATIEGFSGQTADLQDLEDGSANKVLTVGSNGNTLIHPTTGSTTALIVQGASSQTADLLDLENNSGTVLDGFTSAGALQGGNGSGVNNAVAPQGIVLAGGQGTGTGAGGSINFQIAAKGSSGSSLNSLATVETLSGSNGAATFQNSSNSSTGFTVQNTGGTDVLDVDTTDSRIGIASTSPSVTLSLPTSSTEGFYLSSATISTITPGTSGGLATGTYYYKVTALDGTGNESNIGGTTESSVAVIGPTGSVALIWGGVPGAVGGYRVYRGTTTSGENVYYSVAAGTTSFTDTGAAGTAGSGSTNNLGFVNKIAGNGANSFFNGGNVGIGTSTPGNLLSVGALTTASAGSQISVSTGSTTNSGIVVQTVASQSGGYFLQAQNSSGTTLASIDYLGNLVVKNATVNGALTVNGHVITGNSSGSTTAAVNASAGTGGSPVCTVSGNDTGGQITLTTGTSGWASGTQCTITFANAFGTAPHPVISNATNISPSADGVYVNSTTNTFTLNFINADTAQHTYVWNYFNAQ